MIEKFTEILFDPTDIVEIRCLPHKRNSADRAKQYWTFAEDVPVLNRKLMTMNEQGYHIFAGVLPRTAQKAGEDSDTLPGKVLWADIEKISPEAAMRRITKLGLPSPTMAINSGNGVHAYWQLDAKAFPSELSQAVYSLAHYLQADTSVHNPSRIMRVPGFYNTKSAPDRKLAEIFHYEPTLCYSLSDLTSRYPLESLPVPGNAFRLVLPSPISSEPSELHQRSGKYLKSVPGVSEGEGRNNKAHELAKRLRDKGLSEAETYWALKEHWNDRCTPPMADDELYSAVHNGYRYAQREQGCDAFVKQEETPTRRRGKSPTKDVGELPDEEKKIDYVALAMKRYEEQINGTLNTIKLPWPSLRQYPILTPRKCGIVTGTTGVCKTWFVMHLCKTVAETGAIAKYLPLEDDLTYYLHRGAAISAKTWEPAQTWEEQPEKKREMCMAEIHKKYAEYFPWWGGIIEQNPGFTAEGKVVRVDQDTVLDWTTTQCEKGARLVVIDSAGGINWESGREPEHKAQQSFWLELRSLANVHNTTILMIVHRKKTITKEDTCGAYQMEGTKRYGDLAHYVLSVRQIETEINPVVGADGLREMKTINCLVVNDKGRDSAIRAGFRVGFEFGRMGPSFEDRGEYIIGSNAKKEK